jgi:hypothetical protein
LREGLLAFHGLIADRHHLTPKKSPPHDGADFSYLTLVTKTHAQAISKALSKTP